MKRHDCKINENLIEAMLDGELDGTTRAGLEKELLECESCRNLAGALSEMRDLLQTRMAQVSDSVNYAQMWTGIESTLEAEGRLAPDPLLLQAFADGELEGRDLIKASDHVANSETAHRRVDAIAEIGDLLRARMESVADAVDYTQMWTRLEAQVAPALEARSVLPVAAAPLHMGPMTQVSWLQRVLAAIGGYRTVLASAATAAILLAVLLPWIMSQPGDDQEQTLAEHPQQSLEIRVVHVDGMFSDEGHQVTVESADGYAPVIYIEERTDFQENQELAPPSQTPDMGLQPGYGNGTVSDPI